MIKTRAFGSPDTASRTYIPQLFGRSGAVASQHYLSCMAARDVLHAGGNAIDAAVAAALVEGLVNPQMNTIGGECPMLIKVTSESRVVSVNGNAAAPALATPDIYTRRGLSSVPEEGVLAAGVPATMHALISALGRFGRLPFAEVVTPALTLAREGFPVHDGLLAQPGYGLVDLKDKFLSRWSGSAGVYLRNDKLPAHGEFLRNPPLASVFDLLANAERTATGNEDRNSKPCGTNFIAGISRSTSISSSQNETDF